MGGNRLVRHRVAVDQNRLAKGGVGVVNQPLQSLVPRVPMSVYPRLRLVAGDLAMIDGAAPRHDAGNHPKARGDARVMRAARHIGDHGGV